MVVRTVLKLFGIRTPPELSAWITTSEVSSRLIWELLPDSGVTVKSIIDEIADVAKLEPHYVSLSKRQLSNGLPEYLVSEHYGGKLRYAQLATCF